MRGWREAVDRVGKEKVHMSGESEREVHCDSEGRGTGRNCKLIDFYQPEQNCL